MRTRILLPFLLAACHGRTELMIGVVTDIKAPNVIDTVQLQVTRVKDGFVEEQLSWPISGIPDMPFNLPGSYGVYSDGDEVQVDVQLSGLKGDQTVVTRRAVMNLVEGQTLFYRMGLTAGCISRTDCGPDQSCVEGTCRDVDLDSHQFPTYTGEGLVHELTCDSGVAYIDTSTGEPMPMSPDASSCAAGLCSEGTCLKPPTGGLPDAGAPMPDAGAPMPLPSAQLVQGGLSYPSAMTASDTALYWTNQMDVPWETGTARTHRNQGEIWTSEFDGSNPHVIASGQDEPGGIAVDGTTVYWMNTGDGMSSTGALMKLDTTTGTISTVSSNEFGGYGMVIYNHDLYYLSNGQTMVLRAGASSPQMLSSVGGQDLATDGQSVYIVQYADATGGTNTGQVVSIPIGGGSAMTVLATNQPEPLNVATDGAYVFWVDQAWQQPFPATYNRIPVAGGAVETLVSEPPNESSTVFAIDGASLFYMVQSKLWSVPKPGGTPKAIATLPDDGCPSGHSFAIHAGSLYFPDLCSQAVYRVPLP